MPTNKGAPLIANTDANNGPVQINAVSQWASDNLPQSMTSAARDALTGSALWDGRTIWNSTNSRRERYDAAALAWREESVSTSGGSTITASGAGVRGLVVKGAAAQTANLIEVVSDSGAVLARIASDGSLGFSGTVLTGSPGAGPAGATPANPQGYIVVRINGTDRQIAYY